MKNFKLLSRSLLLSFVVGMVFFAGAASARQVSQSPGPVNLAQPNMQKELAVLFVERSSFLNQDLKLVYYDPQTGLTQENILATVTSPPVGWSNTIRKTDMVIGPNNDIDIVYLVSTGTLSSILYHIHIPQNNLAAQIGPVAITPVTAGYIDFDLDIDEGNGEVYLVRHDLGDWNIYLGRKAAGGVAFTMTNPYSTPLVFFRGGGLEVAHNNTTGNIHISFNDAQGFSSPGNFKEIIIDPSNNVSVPQQINGPVPVGRQFFTPAWGKAYNLKPSVALFCQQLGNVCQGIYVNKHQNFSNPQLGWDANPVLVSPTGKAADLMTIPPDGPPAAGVLAALEGISNRTVNVYFSGDFVTWTPSLIATQPTGNYVEVAMPKVINPNNATNSQYSFAVATTYYYSLSSGSGSMKADVHISTPAGWRTTTIKDDHGIGGGFSCIRAEWLKI